MPVQGQITRVSLSEIGSSTVYCQLVERRHNTCAHCHGDNVEPSLAELVSDPCFLQLMASDGVQMETFNNLVNAVRRRLGADVADHC
jgi:hypothetical protein